MEQAFRIEEALKSIKSFDWYWRMSDYGYESNYQYAKAKMREFVRTVAGIENQEIKDALKALWTLNFEEARASVNGRELEGFKEKEIELMNIIAA